MTNTPNYEQLLTDIELEPSQKQYRRLAEMAYNAIADDVEDIAANLANEYFPNQDHEDDDFVNNFLIPLQDKICDAVKSNF